MLDEVIKIILEHHYFNRYVRVGSKGSKKEVVIISNEPRTTSLPSNTTSYFDFGRIEGGRILIIYPRRALLFSSHWAPDILPFLDFKDELRRFKIQCSERLEGRIKQDDIPKAKKGFFAYAKPFTDFTEKVGKIEIYTTPTSESEIESRPVRRGRILDDVLATILQGSMPARVDEKRKISGWWYKGNNIVLGRIETGRVVIEYPVSGLFQDVPILLSYLDFKDRIKRLKLPYNERLVANTNPDDVPKVKEYLVAYAKPFTDFARKLHNIPIDEKNKIY